MPSEDLSLAIAHYALMFPTLASLGTGNPPDAWKAEYDAVASTGLASTLINQVSSEQGSTGAERNFSQTTLMWALHHRRAQLDPTYTAPFSEPPKIGRRSLSTSLRFRS